MGVAKALNCWPGQPGARLATAAGLRRRQPGRVRVSRDGRRRDQTPSGACGDVTSATVADKLQITSAAVAMALTPCAPAPIEIVP